MAAVGHVRGREPRVDFPEVPKVSIIRFPTERCRLPGETELEHFSRQMAAFRQELIATTYAAAKKWELPLLDELARGVESSIALGANDSRLPARAVFF